MTYEQIVRYKRLPIGTYIFSDIELLTPSQAEKIAKIWQQLSTIKGIRLLNHPTCSMKRYELLRNLHHQGWNEFNVYYIDEQKTPNKFPVFLRVVNDHYGSRTPLLNTKKELEYTIDELIKQGKSKEDRIITEFCNTSDDQGIFRKYSALVIDKHIMPISLCLGHDWMLKNNERLELIEKMRYLEEPQYVETNPHESELREIFQLARINYGRIDYSILNGKIVTWEINTNPYGFFTIETDCYSRVFEMPINEYLSKQLKLAFKEVDCNIEYTGVIEVPIKFKNINLKFPVTNFQNLKLLLRSLLPYPYKTYPYKILIEIRIKKFKLLFINSWTKVIDYWLANKTYEIL